jgi:NAD+ kinase
MKNIALVVKKDQKAEAVAVELKGWLEEKGLSVRLHEPNSVLDANRITFSGSRASWEEVDLVVVLGGDGTLLYAARTFGQSGAPLLGVNLGGLGFLTEISLDNLYPTLEKVLQGCYQAVERMMLSAKVIRGGRLVTAHTVLNDAVINKGALARILELEVKVDGRELSSYRADGLIIATPTGSTAYNLSAGGPIVHPAHETIILTPICPFTLSNRPLILPASVVIEVQVDPQASDVILTSDGQVSCALEPGDLIVVEKSASSISVINNPYKDYFAILRTKLGWG